ncbi:DUF3987 domain-containing protein [Maribellus sediminis]|uniref:DUF3987 domain-containing protein n=1 Tax=Maribellus sediminis TaxID=2696285 RepID=UPI00142F3FBF|nr:DUF3987 domain-containing protein [Maribellus sediminis]
MSEVKEKCFNPHDWRESKQLPLVEDTPPVKLEQSEPSPELIANIEQVVKAIEDNKLDITTTYPKWRGVGFGLADSCGESGRKYYHRISKQYPEYDEDECDLQYDRCLKADGTGDKIKIATLFYLAKEAGIGVSNSEDSDHLSPLPRLSKIVYDRVPGFFHQVVKVGTNDAERDILLIGALATISAVLPNVRGIYDSRNVYANLYAFVMGKPGSGKSKLDPCRKLVKAIQDHYNELHEQEYAKYQAKMAMYKAQKKDDPSLIPPVKPKKKLIILPANNTAPGMFDLVNNNGGWGLIFETEADALANAFRNKDFGSINDFLRKAFQHETASSYRKSEQELFEIEEPKLSVVLSGTPQQVLNLIPNAENGLFSRFGFYSTPSNNRWKDVFREFKGTTLDDHFQMLGERLLVLYTALLQSSGILFELTEEQQGMFNQRYDRLQNQNATLLGDHFDSVVKRMGLIVFRIAMIFTVIRNMDSITNSESLVCNDDDFNNAMAIGEVLLEHSKHAFRGLKETPIVKQLPNHKERFYNALPEEFDFQTYSEIAEKIGLNPKTVQKYVREFCNKGLVQKIGHNQYKKNI